MTSMELETVNAIRGRNFISKFLYFLITDEKTGAVSFSSMTTKFAAIVSSYLIVEFSIKIHYGQEINPSWIQFLMVLLTVSGLWHLGRRMIQSFGSGSTPNTQQNIPSPANQSDVNMGGN